MQTMKTIAVDIDDVLAANAEGFVNYSNKKWGTRLGVEDYEEHWAAMWQTDHEETERRAIEFHESGEVGRYRHFEEAVPVLRGLGQHYRLIIVTSRRRMLAQETLEWINRIFPDTFAEIHHAGFWDDGRAAVTLTKADLCKQLGVDYLIDDQTKHCLAAAEIGIKAILFGNYRWNQTDRLPPNVTRCHDWHAVREYFRDER